MPTASGHVPVCAGVTAGAIAHFVRYNGVPAGCSRLTRLRRDVFHGRLIRFGWFTDKGLTRGCVATITCSKTPGVGDRACIGRSPVRSIAGGAGR